jgi:hypothetical protein
VQLDGTPRGFSTFFNQPPPDRFTELHPDGSTTSRPTTDLGGGRHRSAVAFCSALAPAAALVASTDDRLTLLLAQQPGLVTRLRFGDLGALHNDLELFRWSDPLAAKPNSADSQRDEKI